MNGGKLGFKSSFNGEKWMKREKIFLKVRHRWIPRDRRPQDFYSPCRWRETFVCEWMFSATAELWVTIEAKLVAKTRGNYGNMAIIENNKESEKGRAKDETDNAG